MEEAKTILPKYAPGFTWNKKNFQRKVLGYTYCGGEPCYSLAENVSFSGEVIEEFRLSGFVIPFWRMDSEIEADEKSVEEYKLDLEIIELKRQRDERLKQKRENTFGFTDGLSPMQKARVLKILNEYRKVDGVLYIRKEFVEKRVSEGWIVQMETISYQGRKINGERKGKTETKEVLVKGDYIFDFLTKTETDYAKYLIGIGFKAGSGSVIPLKENKENGSGDYKIGDE